MSRQVEQALLSLIPTHGSDLPAALVDLASSLLAQSRHRASTLKAEEEIARLYACANIACDRLKISFDLPPIEPRPPIPPRIYKRLYTHLDNILPNAAAANRSASGRVRMPSSRTRSAANSPASQPSRVPSRATPTKEKSLAQFCTPPKANTGTPSRVTGKDAIAPSDTVLDPWIRPVTRFICADTDQKHLGPSIMAGMEAIVAPGGRKTDDEWVNGNITSLFAAIYFFVIMRVRAVTSGDVLDREAYVPQRKEILALLSRARKEVTFTNLDEEDAWVGWTTLKSKDFNIAVEQVNERDWLTGDWYKGIADVVKRGQQQNTDAVDEEDDFATQLQVRRADTMFQEKYDYLSDARRSDYAAWKESALSRISQLMALNTGMEVDAN